VSLSVDLINSFHKHYYESEVWKNTNWLGYKALKCPFDLWIYQEIIVETKPDWIIECGTNTGGSSLFLASICDFIGNGRILTIDIMDAGEQKPVHPRIEYLIGSSTSNEIVDMIKKKIPKTQTVMVILDSDHTKRHVLNELNIYHKLVTKGNYLIVEDTNINGHPVLSDFGEGPSEAIEEFLSVNNNFFNDRDREKFFLTFNPKGYLKKIKSF
jgi:cephalosporin hydroxylase